MYRSEEIMRLHVDIDIYSHNSNSFGNVVVGQICISQKNGLLAEIHVLRALLLFIVRFSYITDWSDFFFLFRFREVHRKLVDFVKLDPNSHAHI